MPEGQLNNNEAMRATFYIAFAMLILTACGQAEKSWTLESPSGKTRLEAAL
jgi:hypothetical protein